ncbi:hypothetical protein V6N13_061308 [Hibiscus sabdariffa]
MEIATGPRRGLEATTAPGASTFSIENTVQAPGCGIYKKNHYGHCKSRSNACYLCEETGHYVKDCPRNPNKVPARTPTNVSNAPSNRNRGSHRVDSGNQSRGKGKGPQLATTAQESESKLIQFLHMH